MNHDIILIGSGNLATALGLKLQQAGNKILQVYSRNIDHGKQLASRLNCDAIDSFKNISNEASIYLLCIKDDTIASVSHELSKSISKDKLIAHSSGVNSPLIIDEAFNQRGLFYPLQSFSKTKVPDWTDVPVFIEGNEHTQRVLRDLANGISREILVMNEDTRIHLHLASVFANNFSNYNLIIAKKVLDRNHIPFHVLKALMRETVEKAFAMDPFVAQTGPAKRGDEHSIEKHIRLLVKEFPEYRSLYKKYSQIIQQSFKHENIGTDPPS